MKKRILSFLLSVVMLVGMLPTTALAADNVTVTVYLSNAEDMYGQTATVTIAGSSYTGTVSRSWSLAGYSYYVRVTNATASAGDAVTVSVGGYTGSGTISRSGRTYSSSVTLTQSSGTGTLTVTVVNASGNPLSGAQVNFNGQTGTTNGSGQVSFGYSWDGGEAFDVVATHPTEGYQAVETIIGGTTAATVMLSEPFYYKFSDESSNSKLYYTIDGKTLVELEKGTVLKLDRYAPVSFYTYINPGYTSGSTFAQRSGENGYSSTWISGTYTAIASAPDTIGSYDISQATAAAAALGCDFQFHYSATGTAYRYREFRIVSESVFITVEYDPNGGSLNGSTQTSGDGNYYRHPTVTDAAYASYLTQITVPDTIPVRSGYTFAGWAFNGGIYRAGDTLQIADLWNSEITTDVTYTFVATWTQNPGTLNISKTFSGPEDLPEDFHLTVTGTNGYSTTLLLSDAAKGENSYLWTLDNLIAGVSYTVTEGGYDADGYTFDPASSVTSGTKYIAPGQEVEISLVNNYTVNIYTVTWKNDDGTVLETDADAVYGTMPSYDGDTPTKAADAQNTYVFSGWSPTLSPVSGDTTYIAAYTSTTNTYTVTWADETGTTVLETDYNVPYGSMPGYDGDTPTKTPTAQYHYTFAGWTPTVSAVTGDATYQATFSESDRYYTVEWLNHNKIVLETDPGVKYGTTIDLSTSTSDYSGPAPTKAADADYTYEFAGWAVWAESEHKDNPITGNTSFIATFTPVPIPRTATVEVVLNGTFDDDDNRVGSGVNVDIEDLVSGSDGKVYLLGASAAEYLRLDRTSEGVYSLTGIANGSYHVYLKVNGSYVQVGAQELTISNADRTRYLPYYSVSYVAEGAANVPETSYHYSDTSAFVSGSIPTKDGALFTGWSDGSAAYAPGDTISAISSAHTLTAQWQDAAKVDLTVKVVHTAVSDSNTIDSNPPESLSFHISRMVSGNYVSIHDTAQTVNNWHNPTENVTTYTAYSAYQVPAVSDPSNSDYSGFASLDGYRLLSADTVYDSETATYGVTVTLQYAPTSFSLSFNVVMAEGTPANLVPDAVDVAVTRWDAATSSWTAIPGYEDRTIEVTISPLGNGSYGGSGSFTAWADNEGTPFYYRITVVDVDLPGTGHFLPMSGDGINYSSAGNDEHPDGAYTASVTVTGGGAPASGALDGAYYAANVQNGAITATVTAHPYDILLDEDHDGGVDTTIADRFTVPAAQLTSPSRSGYTFGGWYTGQNGAGTKVIGGEHIKNLSKDLPAGGTLTLYAHWKADLTVTGTVYVDLGFSCGDAERTVNIALQTHGGDGSYYETVQDETISITLVEGKTYATGSYTFENVPDTGTYRVNLILPGAGNVTYQNELSTEAEGYTTTAYTAVDSDNDDTAVVDIHLWPDTYDLGYLVDVSDIGEGFRPTSVDLDLRHDHRNADGTLEGYEVLKLLDTVTGFGALNKISVPRNHANGRLYDYVISTVSYVMPFLSESELTHTHYPENAGQYRPFAVRYTGPANYAETANGDGLNQSVTLKAIFEPNHYTIGYDLAGGKWATDTTPVTLHTWSYDTVITTSPIRDGYTFTGWEANVDGAYAPEKNAINAAVWEPVTLTAKWTPVSYRISYDLGKGTLAEGVTNPARYTVADSFTLNVPSREGYTFAGWTGTGLTEPTQTVTLSAGSTGDRSYTATWSINSYDITIEVENGTCEDGSETSVSYGGSTILSFAANPGHALERVTVDGETALLTDGSYTFLNVQEPHTITVVYATDVIGTDGTSDGIPDIHQATVTYRVVNGSFAGGFASSVVFTLERYNENGLWEPVSSAPTLGSTIPAVYSQMIPNEGYDGSGSWNSTPTADTTVVGDAVYRWTFTGISTYTVTYADHSKYQSGQSPIETSENTVSYGNLISINPNGGTWEENTAVQDQTVTSNIVLSDPVRENYVFAGWESKASSAADIAYLYTAQWEPLAYAIRYDLTGGVLPEGTDNPTAYTVEDSFTLNNPEKSGYSFTGWTGTDLTGKTMMVTIPVGSTGTREYAASWSLNCYTVTWVDEGGTSVLHTDTVEYGAPVPTYDGTAPSKAASAQYTYTFAGWALSTDESNTILDLTDAKVTGDVTYKAVYTPVTNGYTVTWKNDNGTVLETDTNVPYGTTPTFDSEVGTLALAADKNTAQYTYTFAGWTPAVEPVTREATYTATYTKQVNQFTVTWADYDGSVLRTEAVNYGATPSYGGTPVREPDSQNSYAFKDWLDKENKLSDGRVVCDVTLTADYTPTARLFTGRAELYLEAGGTDVLTDVKTLLGSGVKLYFSADGSHYYELSGDNGVYSNSSMPNGNYKLYTSVDGGATYSKLCDQTLTIYGGAATAKEYFHSVTYHVNGGSGGPVSPKYYHEGNGVTVSETEPTQAGYLFKGWEYDTDKTYQAGDTLTSGIYQNYELTARWKEDVRAKVNLTVTLNHSLSDDTGADPRPDGTLKIDLTHRETGTGKDFVEVVGKSVTESIRYTANSKTTEVPFNSIFTDLSGDYDYSVNVFLEHYQVSGTPTITPVTGDDGNITYNVSITLQYNPDLFNLSFTVVADASVPDDLVPTAVDVKVLAWDANGEGTWAPISRHENSTMEVLLSNRTGTGSYNVPVHKTGDNHYYYNVAAAGFTLPDGTQLSAVTEDYVQYTSVGNGTAPGEAVTYAIPLYYGDKAYSATVNVSFEDGEASEVGAYGHKESDEESFHQHGDITVTVSISRYDVKLDLNYDGDDEGAENDVFKIIEDQFRIPADIQTNAVYQPTLTGYSFEGWYTNADCTDGSEVVPGTVLPQNVTLYAKWRPLLTVSGNVAIAGKYNGVTIHSADRPTSAIVTLYRKAPGSSHFVEYGVPATVAIDNGMGDTQKDPGVGTYEFKNLPNDGSTYYITVLARNFTETFWNESITGTNYTDYTLTANTAVDPNNDNTATVHAYLTFTPQTFGLDWKIDAGAIGEAFRPTSASTLVTYDNSPAAGYTWAVITQQIVNGVETGQESSFDAEGISTQTFDVWQYHSLGHAYNYAIRLQSLTYGTETTVTDFAAAPFSISYVYPAFYKSTTNEQDILLTATLTPRTYTISYDLGENGTWGSTTPKTSHTWSKPTNIIGTPVREGYVFAGWDSEAYDAATKQIKASVHQDVTLTAKWIRPEGVVFAGESGCVTYNGAEQRLSGITVSGLPADHSYAGLNYSAVGTAAGNYEGSFSGTVVIRDASGADVTNRFTIETTPGTLTIGKAELTVTAENKSKTYDAQPFTGFTYSLSGFVNGETPSALTGSVSYGGGAVNATAAGSYTITPDVSDLSLTNYSFRAVSGTLTISKAELTVKAVDKSKVYDGQPFTGFTYSLSGFVNGENASVLTGSVSYGGEAVNATAAGSYAINPNVAALHAVNYSFKVSTGTLTIAPDENGNGIDDGVETKYTVTYKKAENTDMAADVVHSGVLSGLPIPAPPEVMAAPGYQLGSWTLKEGDAGPGNTLGSSSLVYELATSPCTYSITYVLDGGTNGAGNPTSYTYGAGVSNFADAQKQEYVFQGWYSDSAFANKVEHISSSSTDAVTLYAKWAADGNGDGKPDSRQKKVTFVVVNGTWGGSGTEKTIYVDLDVSGNGTMELPINMEPNSGYANGAWDGGTPNTAVSGSDDVVYTYRYTVISGLSYTIHYLEKGTNIPLKTQKVQDGKSYGDTVSAEEEQITITGYVYDSASAATLTIGADSEANVLSLYYVKDSSQTKTLSYTVKHLLDGVEQVDETKVYEEIVWVNEPNTLTVVAGSLGAKSFPGYQYERTENAPNGAAVADGTVVVLYYTEVGVPPAPSVPPVSTTGNIVLHKVDSADSSTRLSDVVFALYSTGNGVDTFLRTYTTDANGQISIVGLDAGKYYWLEVRAQEGYMLDHNKYPFTIDGGQTETMTITNTRSAVPDVFSGDHYAYIIGYSDGLVHPEAKITRAEVATIFFRLLDDATRERYMTRSNAFPDVEEGMWFNTAVSTMAAMSIVNGYPDGNFHPNEYITRAEFAAIASRFDKNGNTTGVSFSDIYGHWAQNEINIATNNGWILGYEDVTFRPDQQIIRAEAMAMVNRVLQRIPEYGNDLLDSMVIWPDNMDITKWYYLTVQEATNSHDYNRKANGYEYWTDLREVRDWTALEQ